MNSSLKIKSLATLLLITLLLLPAAAKKKNGGNPVMTMTESTYDFGIIPEKGGPVSHEFEFTNTGNGPLVILNATADCGCTRPEYPKNPIAPGKKGKIKVTFLPKNYAGGFVKNVKIKTNAKPKMKVIKISGTVNPNK